MLRCEKFSGVPSVAIKSSLESGTQKVQEWAEVNHIASIISISHSISKLDDGRWEAIFVVWYYTY